MKIDNSDLVIGLSGGLSAGIGIWLIDFCRETFLFYRDEKRIINFFNNHINKEFSFFETHRIASEVNLTIERVNFVCSYSKKIRRNEQTKECWTRVV